MLVPSPSIKQPRKNGDCKAALRKQLKKATPYLLNGFLVLTVAVYVFAGALAIRHIEATRTGFITKAERILENTGRAKLNNDEDTLPNAETVLKRFKRKTPLYRSRRCVQNVISRLASDTVCSQTDRPLDLRLLEELDNCYEDDLKQRFRRTPENPAIINVVSNRTKSVVHEDEWEYWSIKDSVLFCFTVITTIGYGNVAPQSTNGQVFVIVYGLIGVPFTMLVIANLGKFLAEILKVANRNFVKLLKCKFCRRRTHPSKKALLTKFDENANEIDETGEGNAPFGLFITFLLYIVIGSMVISFYEPDMDFFKAIYFNFITLTTIGLGDVIPQSGQHLPFTLCYVALGLALTTIAIEIASDYLKKLHYFGRKLENTSSVKIWFGSKQLTMAQLVKNLGDKFNLEVGEIENLNLDQFVSDAIKVEQGELDTLRDPTKCRPIYITDFKNPYRQGRVLYIDQEVVDELSSGVYTNSEQTSLTSASQDNNNEEEEEGDTQQMDMIT